jgi:hypothetical protein
MHRGAVIVDVAVDQGGCIETTRPTTHSNPTFYVDDVLHYCVANMPGAVPRTSTFALTNATLPFALKLAKRKLQRGDRLRPASEERGQHVARTHLTYRGGRRVTGAALAIDRRTDLEMACAYTGRAILNVTQRWQKVSKSSRLRRTRWRASWSSSRRPDLDGQWQAGARRARLQVSDRLVKEELTVEVIKAERRGVGDRGREGRVGEQWGIDFEPMTPRQCGNDCVFCFIQQNPEGIAIEPLGS